MAAPLSDDELLAQNAVATEAPREIVPQGSFTEASYAPQQTQGLSDDDLLAHNNLIGPEAVAKQESGGAGDLTKPSPAGALWKMQVMPSTAHKPGYGVTPAKSDTPEEYDRVGRELWQKFQGIYDNPYIASAAYNAGPGIVDDWLGGTNKTGKNPRKIKLPDPRTGADPREFVDRIPFGETKDYVYNVAANAGVPITRGKSQGLSDEELAQQNNLSDEALLAQNAPAAPQQPQQAPQPEEEEVGWSAPIKGAEKAARGLGRGISMLESPAPETLGAIVRAVPGVGEALQSMADYSQKTPKPPAPKFIGPKVLGVPVSEMAYGLGESAPALATAPIGGPLVAGAVTGFQNFSDYYDDALKKSGGDKAAALQRASEESGIDAAATALGWKLFEFTPFKRSVGTVINNLTGARATIYEQTVRDMMKNIAVQGLGVQPAVGIVQQAAHNWLNGDPITQGLPEAYAHGAVAQTLMMGFLHLVSPPGPHIGVWRLPKGPTAYEEPGRPALPGPTIEGRARPVGPEEPPPPGGPGAGAPEGQLVPGSVIGLTDPSGTPKRARVIGQFQNGQYTSVQFENGQHRDYPTAEIVRDMTEAPKREEPVAEAHILPSAEEAPESPEDFGYQPPMTTGRRAPTEPQLGADQIRAIDMAESLERAALRPPTGNYGPTADKRQAMLEEAAMLRRRAGVGATEEAIRAAAPARDPGFEAALDDVRQMRSPVPRTSSILDSIVAMGGIRTRDASGNVTKEGQDILHSLRDYRRPGLINNKYGVSPDDIRSFLGQRGWFGPRAEDWAGMDALYDAVEQDAQGDYRVYHPQTETAKAIELRKQLEEEMHRAEIPPDADNFTAARMLADFRSGSGHDEHTAEKERDIDREVSSLSPQDQEVLKGHGYEPGSDYGEEYEPIDRLEAELAGPAFRPAGEEARPEAHPEATAGPPHEVEGVPEAGEAKLAYPEEPGAEGFPQLVIPGAERTEETEGLPVGHHLVEGRGQLGKGKWAVADALGKHLTGYFESKEEAARQAHKAMKNRAEAEAAKAEKQKGESVIAERLKAGEEPTDADLQHLGLKASSEFSYLSPVIQRLFGIPAREVRKALGEVLKKSHTDSGAEKSTANAKKALKKAAAYAKEKEEPSLPVPEPEAAAPMATADMSRTQLVAELEKRGVQFDPSQALNDLRRRVERERESEPAVAKPKVREIEMNEASGEIAPDEIVVRHLDKGKRTPQMQALLKLALENVPPGILLQTWHQSGDKKLPRVGVWPHGSTRGDQSFNVEPGDTPETIKAKWDDAVAGMAAEEEAARAKEAAISIWDSAYEESVDDTLHRANDDTLRHYAKQFGLELDDRASNRRAIIDTLRQMNVRGFQGGSIIAKVAAAHDVGERLDKPNFLDDADYTRIKKLIIEHPSVLDGSDHWRWKLPGTGKTYLDFTGYGNGVHFSGGTLDGQMGYGTEIPKATAKKVVKAVLERWKGLEAKAPEQAPPYDFANTFPEPWDAERERAGRQGFWAETGEAEPDTPEWRYRTMVHFHGRMDLDVERMVNTMRLAKMALNPEENFDPFREGKKVRTAKQREEMVKVAQQYLQAVPRDFTALMNSYHDYFGPEPTERYTENLLKRFDPHGVLRPALEESGEVEPEKVPPAAVPPTPEGKYDFDKTFPEPVSDEFSDETLPGMRDEAIRLYHQETEREAAAVIYSAQARQAFLDDPGNSDPITGKLFENETERQLAIKGAEGDIAEAPIDFENILTGYGEDFGPEAREAFKNHILDNTDPGFFRPLLDASEAGARRLTQPSALVRAGDTFKGKDRFYRRVTKVTDDGKGNRKIFYTQYGDNSQDPILRLNYADYQFDKLMEQGRLTKVEPRKTKTKKATPGLPREKRQLETTIVRGFPKIQETMQLKGYPFVARHEGAGYSTYRVRSKEEDQLWRGRNNPKSPGYNHTFTTYSGPLKYDEAIEELHRRADAYDASGGEEEGGGGPPEPPPETPPSALPERKVQRDLFEAEKAVETEPSEAQKLAENYKHGHVSFHGLPISIENPAGSWRRGVGPAGPWQVQLHYPYGYIKRTEGADGEHVDVYIGPNPEAPNVYVFDQYDPKTTAFDEHKAVLGANSPEEAKAIYDAGFSDDTGPERRGPPVSMSVEAFKNWVQSHEAKKPVEESDEAVEPTSVPAPFEKEKATTEKKPAGPKRTRLSKLDDVGEVMAGRRKSAKEDLDKDTGDKGLEDILEKTRAAINFRDVLAPDATTGAHVYAEAIRRTFKSFLEVEGARGGAGRRRWQGNFSDVVKERWQNQPDAVREHAANYIGTMETLRDALSGAKNVAEIHGVLRGLFVGPDELRSPLHSEFADYARAWAWLSSLRVTNKELGEYGFKDSQQLPDKATPLIRPGLPVEKIERLNLPDYRKGKDVTPEDFRSTFGFRGVEFGEWVTGKEGRQHLNAAFDALHDFADVLGIPVKALSLGGRLGLAFGSRGRGRHAAHFEPSNDVINLTKTKGDGSVAHEWWHALDYALRKSPAALPILKQINAALATKWDPLTALAQLDRLLKGTSFIRGNQRQHPVATGKQYVDHLWRNSGWGARTQTNYKYEADKLGKDYWGKPEELWARSGESYIFDKLQDRGSESPYLVNDWVADGKVNKDAGYRGTPYPTDAERKNFNNLWDALLKNLHWDAEDGSLSVLFGPDATAFPDPAEAVEDALKKVDIEKRYAELQKELADVRRARSVPPASPEPSAKTPAEPSPEAGGAEPSERGGGESGGGGSGLGEHPDRGRTSGREPAAGEEGGSEAQPPDTGGIGRAPGDTSEGRGDAEGNRAERGLRGQNYRIDEDEVVASGSPRERIAKNIKAVEIALELEKAGVPASLEQQRELARFVGWGGLPQIFDEKNSEFSLDRARLRLMLTPEQYDAAKASTINAHYTSSDVVRAVWHGLKAFGFPGGSVLEPGMGVGNFIGMAPDDLASQTRFTGVELDDMTAKIAKLLYPEAAIHAKGFEDTALPVESFDAVIGNVPFAEHKPFDETFNPGRAMSLHNYFIYKAAHLLKPGGLMNVITSHYTLDSQSPAVRSALEKVGLDLLGAIRLPNTAFRENAGTQVVADVLIFRKRLGSELPQATNWTKSKDVPVGDGEARVNDYFIEHPEYVLGEQKLIRGMHRENEYSVVGPAQNLGEKIRDAEDKMADEQPTKRFAAAAASTKKNDDLSEAPSNIKDGAFYLRADGTVMQRQGPVALPAKLFATQIPKMKSLIKMRDLAREVLEHQRSLWDGEGTAPWSDAQRKLNAEYDRFKRTFGPINKMDTTVRTLPDGELQVTRRYPNFLPFRNDPDAFLVAAIENYDEETGAATKAPIMSERVVSPLKEITHVDTPDEALIASMNLKGGVDLPYMLKLLGREGDPEAIAKDLPGRVFKDPANSNWHLAESYLSGNVRAKLAIARLAAQKHRDFQTNVDALEAVQPPDLPPSKISVRLGAPWIPPNDIADFITHLLGSGADVVHAAKEALWKVKLFDRHSVANQSTWGASGADAERLIEDALNQRPTTITYRDDEGKTHTDEARTVVAQEKQNAIKQNFEEWLWSDPDRASRLATDYNARYNNLSTPKFDGTHLTLPGSSNTIMLRPTQTKAVWRYLVSGNTLLDHVVGSGKTFTSIAAGMEARRIGLLKKPAFVVPNHMLEQFSREFLQMYPNAHILVADQHNFESARRRQFVAKAAAGNWDAVIMTHSSFGMLGMSNAFKAQFMANEIRDYERMLRDLKEKFGEKDLTVKQLQHALAKRREKLKEMLQKKGKDKGLTFEETGIDGLFIDEAHLFKNLEFATKTRGMSAPASERAFDLYLKTRYVDGLTPGRGLMFMTGTPISNSMAEMFTMQRYLGPRALAERGLAHFDAWAATFGDMVTKAELAPEGGRARLKTRFGSFRNIPELVSMYRQYADLVTQEMLLANSNIVLPAIMGGGVKNHVLEPSDELRAFVQELGARADAVRQGKVDREEDNMLVISMDGRKASIDMRLVKPTLAAFPGRKAAAVANNVHDIWERTTPFKGTQLVFSDLATPKAEGEGYSVYNDIRDILISKGIPRHEIAFAHDADTDVKKARLFSDVRAGKIRVLIGSTDKMGIGTNVQKRLKALHDVDAPWRPADLEQRHGRIIRQGNENAEIELHRYVTEGSFDAYMWQTLERKARFINQVKNGDPSVRIAEDIDDQTLSYAEVKALASGNPLILEKAKIDSDVEKLTLSRAAHRDQALHAQWDLKRIPEQIAAKERLVKSLEKDAETAEKNKPAEGKFEATLGGTRYTERAKAAKAIGQAIMQAHMQALAALPASVKAEVHTRGFYVPSDVEQTKPVDVPVGKVSGFDIAAYSNGLYQPLLIIKGAHEHEIQIELDKAETGGLTRLENAIRKLPVRLEEEKQDIETLKQRSAELEKFASKPWPREEDYKRALARQNEIDAAIGVEKPGGVREEAERYAPPFFSALTRAAENAKQDKAPPMQWLGLLKNTPGVKQDEIDWAGLEPWLAEQKGSVTKQQVADFLKSNEVQLREVHKGEAPRKTTSITQQARAREQEFSQRLNNGEQLTPSELSLKGWLEENPNATDFEYLTREYDLWLGDHPDLPRMSADELAHQLSIERNDRQPNPTPQLDREIAWLTDFGRRWESAEAPEGWQGVEGGPGPDEARWKSYTLPGGQNYREMLLTLPVDMTGANGLTFDEIAKRLGYRGWHGNLTDDQKAEVERVYEAQEIKPTDKAIDLVRYFRIAPEVAAEIKTAEDAQRLRQRNLNFRRAAEPISDERASQIAYDVTSGKISLETAAVFTGSHWNEPNVAAHVRFDDRWTSADGTSYTPPRKTLHLAEVQSDWGELGRKHGFGQAQPYTVIDQTGAVVFRARSEEAARAFVADRPDERLRAQVTARGAVPDMPFKKTWHELVLKRMLRYAAENGYDALSWDTGDTNADRYDLSHHIDSIEHLANGDGTYDVTAMKRGQQFWHDDRVSPEYLAETFGKEIADKIVAGEGHEGVGIRSGTERDYRSLRGLDLKIGGEGMRGFYDKILPAFMNRYVKKWGAKVGKSAVRKRGESDTGISGGGAGHPFTIESRPLGHGEAPDDNRVRVADNHTGDYLTDWIPREEAQRFVADQLHEREGGAPVHIVPITPQMHESVLRGQPLFSPPRIYGGHNIGREPGRLGPPRDISDQFANLRSDMLPIAVSDSIRNYLIDRGNRTGTEALIVHDIANNRIAHAITNDDPTGVDFTDEMARAIADPNLVFVSHHNHPSDRPPSMPDFVSLADLAMRWVFVHGHKGDWWGMTLTPQARETLLTEPKLGRQFQLAAIADAADKAIHKDLISLVLSKKISLEAANMAHFNLLHRAIEWAGVSDFPTSQPIPSSVAPFAGPVIIRAARAVAKQADELKLGRAKDRLDVSYRHAQPVRFQEGMADILGGLKELSAVPGSRGSAGQGAEGLGREGPSGRGPPARSRVAEPTQEDTPAFKAWFGKSTVVDAAGRPLVVYHGTGQSFDAFHKGSHFGTLSAAHQRLDELDELGEVGRGIEHGYETEFEPRVVPVYLSIENPLRISDQEASDENTFANAVKDGRYPQLNYNDAVRQGPIVAAERAGHDGFVYRNAHEDKGKDSYVPFHPNQIKSAIGNRGTFGPGKSIVEEPEERYPGGTKTPEEALQKPETVEEGKDYIDDVAKQLGAEAGGSGRGIGTYARKLLGGFKSDRGRPSKFLKGNSGAVERFVVFPRTLASTDWRSGKYWSRLEARDRKASEMLSKAGEHSADYFALPKPERAKVHAVEEIIQQKGWNLADDGRTVVVRNDMGVTRDELLAMPLKALSDRLEEMGLDRAAARAAADLVKEGYETTIKRALDFLNPPLNHSKPGDIIRLEGKARDVYFQRREMFRERWRDLMKATAVKFGWNGPIDPEKIREAAEKAEHPGEKHSLERIANLLEAMAEHERVGYNPNMRFGDYFIAVMPQKGVDKSSLGGFPWVLNFQLVESEPSMLEKLRVGNVRYEQQVPESAKKIIKDLRERYPETHYRIETGYTRAKPDMLRNLDIPAIEKLLTLLQQKDSELYGPMVEELKKNLYEELLAGFKKRKMLVPGYSSDSVRVTGSYLRWTSGHIADLIHGEDIRKAQEEYIDRHPDKGIRDYWKRYDAYQQEPAEMMRRFNQFAFYWYLAANPASAVVIGLHGPMTANFVMGTGLGVSRTGIKMVAGLLYPALHQAIRALRADGTSGIHLDLANLKDLTPEERKGLERAESVGLLHGSAADELLGHTVAASNDIEALEGLHKAQERALAVASSTVSAADRMNRVAIWLTAHRLARIPGVKDKWAKTWEGHQMFAEMVQRHGLTPEDLADFWVNEAAFVWGKKNRPEMGRGELGSLYFQFKGFEQNWLSTVWKLLHRVPGGQINGVMMLAAASLLAGATAFPFIEDVIDEVESIGSLIGKNPMIDDHLQKWMGDALHSKVMAEAVLKGIPKAFLGVDLSGRLGFGHVIARNAGANPLAIFGALPGLLWNVTGGAAMRFVRGQPLAGTAQLMPAAVKNPYTALVVWPHEGARTSFQSIPPRKRTDQPVVPPKSITPWDQLVKSFGFEPTSISRAYDAREFERRLEHLHGRDRSYWRGRSPYPKP